MMPVFTGKYITSVPTISKVPDKYFITVRGYTDSNKLVEKEIEVSMDMYGSFNIGDVVRLSDAQ